MFRSLHSRPQQQARELERIDIHAVAFYRRGTLRDLIAIPENRLQEGKCMG